MKSFIVTVAVIALSALANTATQAREVNTAKVFYGDLNLSNPSGMQTLTSRIQRASSQVCPGADRDLTTTSLVTKCRTDAVAKAMKKLSGKSDSQIASR